MKQALLFPVVALLAAGASAQAINEVRIDNSGADTDEYVEIAGPAGLDLTGLTFFTIGDGTGGSGVIDDCGGTAAPIDLTGQIIPADGTFLIAINNPLPVLGAVPDLTIAMCLENSDNVTHMLVSGFTGAGGDDLDTDDDGVLDVTPWTAVVDSVCMFESPTSGEFCYSSTVVGPDGGFVPAHAFRSPDGANALTSWNVGDFTLAVHDTPGAAANAAATIEDLFGGIQSLVTDVGSGFAGDIYVIASSVSGTSPGTLIGSVLVPLNADTMTLYSLDSGFSSVWVNTFGTLDGAGRADSQIVLPAATGLVGLTLSSAGVIVDSTTLTPVMATNAVATTWI